MLYMCKFPVDVPMYNLPPFRIVSSGYSVNHARQNTHLVRSENLFSL